MADNVALVRGLYEAFANGDVQTVVGALDGKVEWYEAEHVTYWPGGPFVGPQAVVNGVFARIPQDFDNFRTISLASSAAATRCWWKRVTARP
jgi:uncharacterized protein